MSDTQQGRDRLARHALSRRDFLRTAGTVTGSLALLLVSRCASPPEEEATAPPSQELAGSTPAPTTTAPPELPSATPASTPELMMNENREGWYIRYIKAIPPVDVASWSLSVDGMVGNAQTLDFQDIQALPAVTQRSRMKCVEGWSVAAEWQGFRPQALVDLVQPHDEAAWVHFQCADDYYESLHLREFLMDRVLFAYGANGERLAPEYGFPLRLIVPFKYGYKGPKAIQRVTFSNEPLEGFWPKMGPYTAEGDIVAGVDYALDLDTYQVFDDMGELFYEEGLESQHN
jgi:DMSO/TMAO reductase YedYZ molybdopterin-dependent catalytic subunit